MNACTRFASVLTVLVFCTVGISAQGNSGKNKDNKGSTVSAAAQSEAKGGKQHNHGGAVSTAAKTTAKATADGAKTTANATAKGATATASGAKKLGLGIAGAVTPDKKDEKKDEKKK